MKIRVSNDKNTVEEVRKLLKENGNYCPCRLEKSEDTQCPCKEFREQEEPGECHCGLYIKEAEHDVWDVPSSSNVPTETHIVNTKEN